MVLGLQIFMLEKHLIKADSNYICCSVILMDSVPKKDETIICKCFQKNTNTLKKTKQTNKQYLDIYTDGLKFYFDYSNESNEK